MTTVEQSIDTIEQSVSRLSDRVVQLTHEVTNQNHYIKAMLDAHNEHCRHTSNIAKAQYDGMHALALDAERRHAELMAALGSLDDKIEETEVRISRRINDDVSQNEKFHSATMLSLGGMNNDMLEGFERLSNDPVVDADFDEVNRPAVGKPHPAIEKALSDAVATGTGTYTFVAIERPPEKKQPKVIIPTIGRILWYWPALTDIVAQEGRLYPDQPFMARVVCCGDHDIDNTHYVNLIVADHHGSEHVYKNVPIHNDGQEYPYKPEEGFAVWMPYQIATNKKDNPL